MTIFGPPKVGPWSIQTFCDAGLTVALALQGGLSSPTNGEFPAHAEGATRQRQSQRAEEVILLFENRE